MKIKLGSLLEEYSERNSNNEYKPVAVGRYGIRRREDIYSKDLAKDYSKNKIIYKGTLTVGMGSNQIDIGILNKDIIYSVSPAYHTYKIKNINYDYLDFLLKAHNLRMFKLYAKRGSRQGKTLDLKRWLNHEIDIHNNHKQELIVRNLKLIQKIIKKNEDELIELDKLIKARFVEMFNDIKTESSLRDLCTFIDYRGKTPEKAESGLPFITAKNIKMHHMSFETREFISKGTYDKIMTRGFPKIGDVLFTTEAPLGNVCRIPYIETEFYIGQRIITLQTKCLEPVYLEYALSSNLFMKKLRRKSSGSTVKGIRSKLLEQLTIPVPPIELQKKFSFFVQQIDKSKFIYRYST